MNFTTPFWQFYFDKSSLFSVLNRFKWRIILSTGSRWLAYQCLSSDEKHSDYLPIFVPRLRYKKADNQFMTISW